MNLLGRAILTMLFLGTLVATFAFPAEPPLKQPVIFLVYTDPHFSQESAPPQATTIVDPIAVVANGQFVNPPLEDSTIDAKLRDQRVAEFSKSYFTASSEYPLLVGGEKKGILRIEKPVDVSCESQSATASLPTGFSLNESQFALATSSPVVRSHAAHQRPPLPEEAQNILEFAREVFHQEGATADDVKAAKTESIVLTGLDGDSKLEVVGIFSLRDKKMERRLFLVLTASEAGYHTELKVHTATTDLDDLKDLSTPDFLGQLDLDGDGVDEIFVRNSYYESWDYTIYGKKQGTWKKLYQGGGGGC